MFGSDHDLRLIRVSHKIHSTTHTLKYLSGDHEVCEVTVGGDLQGAQDGYVDVAAADHGEGFRGVECGGTWNHGYGFFASVDDVAVKG